MARVLLESWGKRPQAFDSEGDRRDSSKRMSASVPRVSVAVCEMGRIVVSGRE